MNIRAALVACAGATLTALAFFAPGPLRADEGFSMVSTGEVEKELGASGVYLFDANGPDVYAEGHLPGAVLVDRKNLERQLPSDQAAYLIFYCKNPH